VLTITRKVLEASKTTHKNQVTIHKEVRQRFELEKERTLVFMEKDGELVVFKSTEV